MAVDKVMQDSELVEVPERREDRVLLRGGVCLVCGEWIAADASDAYRVIVSNPPREAEYPCHEACLERVAHPSVQLPS